MTKAESVAAASADVASAEAALTAARIAIPPDPATEHAAVAVLVTAEAALTAAKALPADSSAPASDPALTTSVPPTVQASGQVPALLSDEERLRATDQPYLLASEDERMRSLVLADIARELNFAIDHNLPQTIQALQGRYEALAGKSSPQSVVDAQKALADFDQSHAATVPLSAADQAARDKLAANVAHAQAGGN
jgi:hypothetical protein